MVFAVNLRTNDATSRATVTRLCALVGEDLDRPVHAHFAHAPSALAAAMKNGDAHFAWTSPTLLLLAADMASVVPLLSSVRRGQTAFHSVLFASAHSTIQHIDDLASARAAWVAPTSASGYLVARLSLVRHGIDLSQAFGDELFLDSHGAVARAVLTGEADVGATYAHFEGGDAKLRLASAGYTDEDPRADARILTVGGPIPADMIVAHPDVPIRDRTAFAAALSRLVHCAVGGDAIRDIIGADDFHPVSPASLMELDALMRASHDL